MSKLMYMNCLKEKYKLVIIRDLLISLKREPPLEKFKQNSSKYTQPHTTITIRLQLF